jgi:hypothetical protein
MPDLFRHPPRRASLPGDDPAPWMPETVRHDGDVIE